MKPFFLILAAVGAFWATAFATVNAMNGKVINTASTILGKTPVSAVMGQTVASAGSHTTAPVYVNENHTDNAGVTSLTITMTINAGDTVIVFANSTHSPATTVSSVTDSGGSTYAKKGSTSVLPINANYVTECWAVLSATASTSITVNFAASSNAGISVIRYTGVNAFGNTTTAGATGATTHTCTLTMQDANNVIVSGGLQSSATATATVGTLALNNFSNNQGSFTITDMTNTAATSGSLSTTWTSASNNWCAVAVELRSNP